MNPPPQAPGKTHSATPVAAGVFPLSSMQESLWVIEQLFPGTSAYHLAEAWRLRGRLEAAVLRQALDALARRHESLRTIFEVQNGLPVQVVRFPGPFALEEVCLGSEDAITAAMETEVRRPFDLACGPIARATLYRVSDEDHVLLVGMHHIISDEWSMGIFWRELSELYAAGLKGEKATLPELPIQYADFAVWQKELLRNGAFEREFGYWKETLAGLLPGTTLPYDRRCGSRVALEGRTQFEELPGHLVEDLKALSRANGATLFMTLLAAFEVLLQRYTRQTDLVVGTPVANRERVETENLIGFLVNTHALRAELGGDPSFKALLSQARESVLGLYAHQGLPVDKVVEVTRAERRAQGHPLFQTVFGLQPAMPELSLPGLNASRVEIDNGGAKFDWTLLATETSRGLLLRSEFNSQLYDAETMQRVARQYGVLLESIVQNPGVAISKLKLLTEAERAELLTEGNTGTLNHSAQLAGNSLHGLFEIQAARAPQAIALVLEGKQLTYAELDERANALARRLRLKGVGRGTPVAMVLERSFELVVGILGILKAGACYVPMDPASPEDRLRFMIQDTGAPVIVSMEALRSKWPSLPGNWLCLDSEALPEPASSGTELEPSQPDDPAYVIFTSGSTGQPKGVQVTHRNVIRLFQQTEPWFRFGASDVWTLFHSYTFDFSVWELWGALLYGGKLVIVPQMLTRSPREFYDLLVRERVTVLNQTPSAFRQLIWAESSGGGRGELSLRYVICGGEALELQSLKPWFARHGDRRPLVVNMYGITETTVHVTYRVIHLRDVEEGGGSVIGVPIPDLKVYLLDEHLEPVPRGVPGEICVSGAGVARGYLNRPALNAARFVRDPFSDSDQTVMYRSGDLARCTSSGELEYLGRMDDQVKIRGFRIELGEIESALNGHPGIRESLVLPFEGAGGDKRLAAYIAPHGAAPEFCEVRAFLSRKLPEYMLPAVMIVLAQFPLTLNGKVDRRALPAAETGHKAAPERIAPRTGIEKTIAGIWSELLGEPELSVRDNFFHLGGHSLLATQVVARMETAFEVDLCVTVLFECPTIEGLAKAVETAKSTRQAPRERIRRGGEAERAEQLLARLDEMTDEEVATLLGEEASTPLV